MAVCYKCNTEFTGKFCPACGTQAQKGPAPVQYANRMAAPVYSNVVAAAPTHTTSVMGWIGWMILISLLPILGVVIMALAATDESAKNFAKAILVLILVGIILGLIAVGAVFGLAALNSN